MHENKRKILHVRCSRCCIFFTHGQACLQIARKDYPLVFPVCSSCSQDGDILVSSERVVGDTDKFAQPCVTEGEMLPPGYMTAFGRIEESRSWAVMMSGIIPDIMNIQKYRVILDADNQFTFKTTHESGTLDIIDFKDLSKNYEHDPGPYLKLFEKKPVLDSIRQLFA